MSIRIHGVMCVVSTVGVLNTMRDNLSNVEDILSTVGNILCTVRMLSTVGAWGKAGGISRVPWGLS